MCEFSLPAQSRGGKSTNFSQIPRPYSKGCGLLPGGGRCQETTMLPMRLVRWSAAFCRRDRGAATIEVILWLPFFLGLFSLMVDISMIFNNQSRIMRIIQDGNRNYSIRRFETNAETETYVENRIAPISPNASAVTTNVAGLITTTVTVPLADLDLLGIAYAFNNSWQVTADQLDEGFSE